MAEQPADDKNEKASAHKLRKAREQGQVTRSRDWATAVGIGVCLQLLVLATPGYLDDFHELFAQSFAVLRGAGTLDNAWSNLFSSTMLLLVKMVLPLLAVPLIAGIASLFPGGWVLSAQLLKPRLERVNPAGYLRRVFSRKHTAETLISAGKAAALMSVLYYVIHADTSSYLRLQSLPLQPALAGGTRLLLNGVTALCAVFVAFSLIDLPVQLFVFLREQRMSKREVKEEQRTSEGRPEVRQRIRRLQIQIARRSVHKSVPTADVVIVNPEHFAVALKYDEKRAQAPFVIAKGVDEMALYIREVALQHNIEVVALPPLARAIYNTSQIHQQIPATLYKAVARVLSYVLQIKAFRSGRRSSEPHLPFDLALTEQLTATPS